MEHPTPPPMQAPSPSTSTTPDARELSEQVLRLSSEVEARRRFQDRRESDGEGPGSSSMLTQVRSSLPPVSTC